MVRKSRWSESCSVVSDSLWHHGLYNPWNSPGQNSSMGSHSLLQGIFSTQGLNPGLPNCRGILHRLSHQGSLKTQTELYLLKWVSLHTPVLFIYLFLSVLSLHCCMQTFSSCGGWGCSLVAVHRLLLLWSMGSREHGFSTCGAQT